MILNSHNTIGVFDIVSLNNLLINIYTNNCDSDIQQINKFKNVDNKNIDEYTFYKNDNIDDAYSSDLISYKIAGVSSKNDFVFFKEREISFPNREYV